jgi:hypothetical protein
MPQPPHQTDMQSQGLPPKPRRKLPRSPQGSPAVLLVTNPSQLPVALGQHEKPVVIENTPANAWLTYWFKQLLRLGDNGRLLRIAWFIIRLIAQSYNLEYDWHVKWDWIEVGGKINLTPRRMTPPAGEE